MNEKTFSPRPLLFPVLFAFIISYCVNCKKSSPAPAPAQQPPAQQSPPPYFLTYTDSGSVRTFTLNMTSGTVSGTRKQRSNWGHTWINAGVSFPLGQMDIFSVSVSLPLDSSKAGLVKLNQKYVINDSASTLTEPLPGTFNYTKLTTTGGKDVDTRKYDTLQYFNKITSISYAGNRRYDTFEELTLCDFEVSGQFNIQVKNDITKGVRDLSNGSYKFKVSMIAK